MRRISDAGAVSIERAHTKNYYYIVYKIDVIKNEKLY